ncbi:SGNH/GDSL hydrolase family protein [Acaryochloris sp. IP29b_bin.137]|uniref:SGNH/GDSL hydrolase family protein n=1 Tax=Acaryochloris sp. IP29b_bin.137 TaxID=2969217 RepID=UPI00261FA6F0|nr:SGNH/GDSL hydrolase family protein [Acaryochloris sp. IP29b_bin.137]
MKISIDNFSNIYAFGDSLSDIGNLFALTTGQIPQFPYFEGRLSNGPVAVEYLVNRLNGTHSSLDLALSPSFLGGNNYALAGAGTGRNNSNDDDLTPEPLDLPGLLDQIDAYLEIDLASANDLFFIWAGPNDFLDNLGGQNTDDPAVLVKAGVDNLRTAIETLSAAGATQFVIPNLLNLGRLPASVAFCREARAIAIAFNGRLGLSLGNFELDAANANLGVVEVDLFSVGESVAENPARFGFTNITDPLLSSIGSDLALPNPPGFFFWDSFHPTTQAHALFGEVIFNTLTGDIPQPMFNDILGTSGSDFLVGTRTADNLDGLAGHDFIFGLAGSDRIEGWQGSDWLFGHHGNDTIDGGADQDVVWSGPGDDLAFGGAGGTGYLATGEMTF